MGQLHQVVLLRLKVSPDRAFHIHLPAGVLVLIVRLMLRLHFAGDKVHVMR